jgi:hypothetical protein
MRVVKGKGEEIRNERNRRKNEGEGEAATGAVWMVNQHECRRREEG